MKYEELRPRQIDAILRDKPIAYIAWGAHEWHGKQNPIGLDTLKAYNQCLALCAETGGVVLPPVFCGFQTMKPHAGFHHTLEFRRETVQDLVGQYLEQLRDEGFKVIVIVMGHYGNLHVEAIREVCSTFQQGHDAVRVWAFPDYEPTLPEYGGDHAGRNETSLMMHFRPSLVNLEELPADGELDLKAEGIGGADPRQATPQRGEAILKALVANAVPKIEALLREAR